MHDKIIYKSNLSGFDSPYGNQGKIFFIEQITDSQMNKLDKQISFKLRKINIGFHSAHGKNFIQAVFLGF